MRNPLDTVIRHGAHYEIAQYDTIPRTLAVPIAVEGWYWLNEQGFTDNGVLLNWNDSALTVELVGEQRAVAVMVYTIFDWDASMLIKVGYVQPRHRQRGLYTALWNAVVKIAQEKNVYVIAGGRHIDNLVKADVDKAMKRIDHFITTQFKVPKC